MKRWTLLVLLSALGFADTLTLKNGRVLSGSYLGGTTTVIRFAVGDRVETIPTSEIDRLTFNNPSSGAQPASGGVAPATVAPLVTTPNVADKQQRFCEVIDSFRKETMRVMNEPNPIVRAQTRKPDPYDFENRIVALMGTSGRFDRWHGTTRFHVEGQWVILSFFPDCKALPQTIEFATASHYRPALSDDHTLIPLSSPLARGLSRINGNAAVVASGHLFYVSGSTGVSTHTNNPRQRYRGSSDNPAASVAAPRYLAAFDLVELAGQAP